MIKKEKYSAAILVIGDEILSGRTQDTNSNFIAKEMEIIGIDTSQIRVIPDEKNTFKTKQINEICDFHSIKCEQINNINDALKYFKSNQEKIYLITGSLYLIGKIRKKLV